MASNFNDIYEDMIRNLYSHSSEPGPFAQHKNYILSADGTFLGKLTSNKYDSLSIFNPYGIHGSEYSSTSILNPYSIYGSIYSTNSPYNPYAGSPPKVYINNHLIGYLTKNKYHTKPIDPETLFERIQTESQFAY